ncbi:hypothetical protein HDU93_008015 [Gonapodya sp. JEL0774]|nr:hypothetical protein HDU93_008015 [Gonapodya sp. JEL0774]
MSPTLAHSRLRSLLLSPALPSLSPSPLPVLVDELTLSFPNPLASSSAASNPSLLHFRAEFDHANQNVSLVPLSSPTSDPAGAPLVCGFSTFDVDAYSSNTSLQRDFVAHLANALAPSSRSQPSPPPSLTTHTREETHSQTFSLNVDGARGGAEGGVVLERTTGVPPSPPLPFHLPPLPPSLPPLSLPSPSSITQPPPPPPRPMCFSFPNDPVQLRARYRVYGSRPSVSFVATGLGEQVASVVAGKPSRLHPFTHNIVATDGGMALCEWEGDVVVAPPPPDQAAAKQAGGYRCEANFVEWRSEPTSSSTSPATPTTLPPTPNTPISPSRTFSSTPTPTTLSRPPRAPSTPPSASSSTSEFPGLSRTPSVGSAHGRVTSTDLDGGAPCTTSTLASAGTAVPVAWPGGGTGQLTGPTSAVAALAGLLDGPSRERRGSFPGGLWAGLGMGKQATSASGPAASHQASLPLPFPTSPAPAPAVSLADLLSDGPLFRATVAELEKKTESLRAALKKALRAATQYLEAARGSVEAQRGFVESVSEIPTLDTSLGAYLAMTDGHIQASYVRWLSNIEGLLVQPLRKIYESDVKIMDTLKKEFESESNAYYAFLTKHLAMPSDESARKRAESDARYQARRKTFDLKRFDYYSRLRELNGGEKDQELSFIFSNFAEKQCQFYTAVGQKMLDGKSDLDRLVNQVSDRTKSMHLLRKDREEKRRILETRASAVIAVEGTGGADSFYTSPGAPVSDYSGTMQGGVESSGPPSPFLSAKFKGIRDLQQQQGHEGDGAGRRKEGFLYAASVQLNISNNSGGAGYKKMWVVLSNGQLQEYANWKMGLIPDKNGIVRLRFCTVREARNAERRFCFEVIGPEVGRRVYQATDEVEMRGWISTIQNAIEGLLQGNTSFFDLDKEGSSPAGGSKHPEGQFDYVKLLEMLREDPANQMCADCGARNPDWSSINLGCLICIELSGMFRAIGNNVSNAVWEATCSEKGVQRPIQSHPRDVKSAFIRNKYGDRLFVDRSLGATGAAANSLLILSVSRTDFTGVLSALALGADLNHRMNGRHVLHVAMDYPMMKNRSVKDPTDLATISRFSLVEFLLQVRDAFTLSEVA